VVAADGVVVGDRAARGEDRLRGRRLDLLPLLHLAAPHRRGEHGEVGGRSVRIGVGDPAGHAPLAEGRRRALADRGHKVVEAVPGDGGLEGLGEDAGLDHGVA
jgi:hypothetical protein